MEPLLYGVVGFLTSVVVTAAVRPLARRLGIVAPPRADRWNSRPIPLLGGVGIAVALGACAWLLPEGPPEIDVLLAGTFAVFLLGWIDDVRPLRPQTKLIAQVVVAAAAVASGLALEPTSSSIVNAAFSILWIVGLTNAFNLLDNMDGLAAGVAAIATMFRLVFSWTEGDVVGADLSAGFLGALLGFLVFNRAPASIFMGDAGSLLIGFFVAGQHLATASPHTRSAVSVLVLPVLVLLVPIFDTVFVTLTRILANRAVSAGGRDHTSHRLVQLGLSERKAVGILYLAALLGGSVAYSSRRFGFSTGIVLAVMLLVGTAIAGVLLAQVQIAYTGTPLRREKLLRRLLRAFPYKRQLATLVVDTISIVLAYYCAYVLRFEGLGTADADRFFESLPVVVACQVLALALFRTHRGAWRYVALPEVLRLVKASAFAVLLTVFAVIGAFRFQGYSRAIFVLDWVLLLGFLGWTRVGFLLLAELVRGTGEEPRRVLVYGAGDLGEVAIRQILHDRACGRRPVGLVDDDPAKRGLEIHGCPVLGSGSDLDGILRARRVSEVVMADPALSDARGREIEKTCRTHAVDVLPMMMLFPGWKSGSHPGAT